MSKLLLRPPEGTTSFTFNQGCGKPHEFDGDPIDCEKCVQHVSQLSPDERLAMHLRGPAPVQGATPEEREAYALAYLRDRERYSWRIAPADEASTPPGGDADPEEIERLKARIAELEAAAKPAGPRKAAAKS